MTENQEPWVIPSRSPSLTESQRDHSYDLEKVVEILMSLHQLGLVESIHRLITEQTPLINCGDLMTNIKIKGSLPINTISFMCCNYPIFSVNGSVLDNFMIPFCLFKQPITIRIDPPGLYQLNGDAMILHHEIQPYFERLAYYNRIRWMGLYITYETSRRTPPLITDLEHTQFEQFLETLDPQGGHSPPSPHLKRGG